MRAVAFVFAAHRASAMPCGRCGSFVGRATGSLAPRDVLVLACGSLRRLCKPAFVCFRVLCSLCRRVGVGRSERAFVLLARCLASHRCHSLLLGYRYGVCETGFAGYVCEVCLTGVCAAFLVAEVLLVLASRGLSG